MDSLIPQLVSVLGPTGVLLLAALYILVNRYKERPIKERQSEARQAVFELNSRFNDELENMKVAREVAAAHREDVRLQVSLLESKIINDQASRDFALTQLTNALASLSATIEKIDDNHTRHLEFHISRED